MIGTNKKYSRDIKEISSILKLASTKNNCNLNTIKKLTKTTGELYLDNRAKYFIEQEQINPLFKSLLNNFNCIESSSNCSKCPINKYCNTYILHKRFELNNKPQMIDLFCGAGGLSLGFNQEGFKTAVANDIEECCVDTYAHNHPETPRRNIVLGDIRNVINELDSLTKDLTVDIVVGGPPCQGFSMANRQRIIDDPRNKLYKSYVEIVKLVQPKFFVMENVKGMLSVANQVKEDFKEIGYDVECNILNAKDFGVPQNRERLIYIGNRINIDNNKIFEEILSNAKNCKKFFLKDALFGLRELKASKIKNATETESEESGFIIEKEKSNPNEYLKLINQNRDISFVFNHKARYNNERDIEIYRRLNPGEKSDDPKIADIMPYKNRNHIFKDKYYKLDEEKVSKTITAHMKFDCNMYIHPNQARGLTPREAARIQSYPDDYFFRGSYTKTFMQIGNSVPPLLGRVIAKAVKKYLVC